MEEKTNEIFSTRDLYLAASLITLKFRMLGVDFMIQGGKNQPVGFFKFLDTPELQEAKNQYSQGLILIEPKTFITNLKSLKSEVVQAQDNPYRNF